MVEPLHLRFGDAVFDEARRELRRRGNVVAVQPKVLEVLLFLLRHRARAVTREELHDAVWPDVVVGPSSLSRAIREVRKAIGDDGDGPELVRTLPGHGFRFVGEVELVEAELAGEAPKESPALLGRGIAIHGRENELAWLTTGIERAREGRVVVRVVSGEPGMGKTTLLDGLVVRAPSDARILRGRVTLADAGAPLAAWRDVSAELNIDLDHEDDDDRGERRRRRAREVREALRKMAPGGLAVLLLDDADRADSSSWKLVDDLLDGPHAHPLLLVLTIRASSRRMPEVVETMGRAVRADPDAILELAPLGADGLAKLAAELSPTRPSPAAVAKLARLSGGHPLFARHLVHASNRAGRSLETLDVFPLPRGGGLRELVLSYVAELDERHRHVIEAAALLCLPFSPDLVADVADARPTEVADALHAAVDAGLLEPAERGRLVFVHEVVREVVGGSLAPSTSAALHRRAARALQRRLGASPEHLELLAHHFVEGAPDGDVERALEILQMAAEHASRTGAFDVAAHHLASAIDVEGRLESDPKRRAGLYLARGIALARDGRVGDAAQAFSAADPVNWRGEPSTLRAAFFAISTDLPRVVERFYELLFSRHPSVTALFTRSHPTVQRRMFGETLVALVEHAGDTAWLDDHVSALGRRHADYQVDDEMYDWVRDAFLDAIDEASGRAGLSEAVKATWARTYDAVAAKMIAATREALKR